jgi:membrane protein required for colicin V production
MNNFDAVVYIGLVIAMVTGFNTGLVRSAVTILAYLVAVPIAMWAMSALSPPANGKLVSAFAQNGLVFFGVFLFAGMALGKLARVTVDEATGLHAGPVDRLCGAVLGAVRVGLIAVTIVAVFDRLVPTILQPQWLNGSKLRPLLSAAGQRGFSSLPPDLAATFDRLKRDRQI